MRKIIHIDMDAFFASVEQRDDPSLRGRPVIVGGQPDSRGVVAACSYEARVFGIHSAMPSSRAARLCPDAIFVQPRFEQYRQVSRQLQKIFGQYTDLIEPLSLDEAYLDVSRCQEHQGSATLIAKAIKAEVKQRLQLICSAGVSYNKFLAKIASDMDKPDGLYVIRPEQADAFIRDLPIRKFFGVGQVTERKMHSLGIRSGADLQRWSEDDLSRSFGKSGRYYYRAARGIDDRPVRPDRIRKSIGKEITFGTDLTRMEEIHQYLDQLAEQVVRISRQKQLLAKTLTLKVKYQDFTLTTRSLSREQHYPDQQSVRNALPELINRTELGTRPCRLLGLGLSNFQAPHDAVKEASGQYFIADLWETQG